MFLSRLVSYFQLFLLICGETVEKQDRKIAWPPELYPKIQCHKGYDEFTADGGGERVLRELATHVCPNKPVGCYKRCILEYIGILQETSQVDVSSKHYGKLYFEPENWIAENLAYLLFTAEENNSGKKIASALFTQCSDTMQKLNEIATAPTCQEQNKLYLCFEQAMNCEGIDLEVGNLLRKVCNFQDIPFHHFSDEVDKWAFYNDSYPDVSCHNGYDAAAASQAMSIISHSCARSLNGCFKRCLFEKLGVVESITQPKHQMHGLRFRIYEDMGKSLGFYLFPMGGNELGKNLASRILHDCDHQMEMFSDLTTPASCEEENVLYFCIEKAMGCPGKTLQTGTLMTTVCSLQQVEYYRYPEQAKDTAD